MTATASYYFFHPIFSYYLLFLNIISLNKSFKVRAELEKIKKMLLNLEANRRENIFFHYVTLLLILPLFPVPHANCHRPNWCSKKTTSQRTLPNSSTSTALGSSQPIALCICVVYVVRCSRNAAAVASLMLRSWVVSCFMKMNSSDKRVTSEAQRWLI